jgi:hypothetical protein
MRISFLECDNRHLPDPRCKSFWEYVTGVPGEFLLLMVNGRKINRFTDIIYYPVKSVKYEEYR